VWAITLIDELSKCKERRTVLETSIKAKNIESLVKMMDIMGDGQVKVLGNVTDLKSGLKKIGLTEQEY